MNIFDELAKPFPESAIHWRIGSTNVKAERRRTGDNNARPTKGIPLAYIDARDVMQRLDDVVGSGLWQDDYPFQGCCRLGLYILLPSNGGEAKEFQWVWKANGAGETDVEGEKGQYSDAFKRAAVLWGVGRYLYDLPNTWLPLDPSGYKFAEAPKLPQWATPNGWGRITASVKQEVYKQTVEALENGDGPALREIWDEFDKEEKVQLWSLFDSKQRSSMKELNKDD